MPAVTGNMYGGQQGPSCFDRMKMGAMIGFCVGMASGAIFGGVTALRCEYAVSLHFFKLKKQLWPKTNSQIF